jgi:hypothetical protein
MISSFNFELPQQLNLPVTFWTLLQPPWAEYGGLVNDCFDIERPALEKSCLRRGAVSAEHFDGKKAGNHRSWANVSISNVVRGRILPPTIESLVEVIVVVAHVCVLRFGVSRSSARGRRSNLEIIP